jgi:hypothetical protein
METELTVICPFCGQRSTLLVDASVRYQRFTTDCEVCCRPFEVACECDSGEVIATVVDGG